MLRRFISLSCVVLPVWFGVIFGAQAYINTPINKLTEPKVTIVVPRHFINRNNDRVYTPDQYNCYMKKTLKYCADRKGRALNGVIVNSQDGGLSYENYQSGYQSGETLLYTQDGTLISRSNYKKGLKNGEEIIYFVNGNVEYVMHYDAGVLDGRVEQYNENGILVGKFTYKKGWFREGYCQNEAKGSSMRDRLKNKEFNVVVPCGS